MKNKRILLVGAVAMWENGLRDDKVTTCHRKTKIFHLME